MNRRAFLLNTLEASGAAAALSLVDAQHLLAIPPEPNATGWSWDGSAESYLAQLTDFVLGHLRHIGKSLTRVEGIRPYMQLHAGFDLSETWRLTATSADAIAHPAGIVCQGQALLISRVDPVSALRETAAQFADQIVLSGRMYYLDLELPRGVHTALRDRLFRLIAQYDLPTNRILMRVDTLLA